MASRVNYANYVQKRQLILQNEANQQNPYPPTNDAAIIPFLKFGEANTTGAEYEEYLAQVAKYVPGAPTIVAALGRDTSLLVLFTAPGDDGRATITNYEYSLDSGATWIGTGSTTSPILIAGLSNGTSYTVTIRAVNSVGAGAASNSVAGTPVAPSDQRILFTNVGPFMWTAPDGVTSIELLVVGGGGGSGAGYDNGGGGGGGGGEVLYYATYTVVPGTTYSGTVGAGGIAGTVDSTIPVEVAGGSGGDSIFDTIVSPGGGGGRGSREGGTTGAGGTAANAPTASTGGIGGGASGGGGGGGGAQGNGGSKSGATPGNGGSGVSSIITGGSVTYGRGGAGAAGSAVTVAIPGLTNRGYGASAGGDISLQQEQGAAGGSGIVIVKYTGYV